ncbi:MAG: hypothetical protein EZS28_051759 [Streblomastix strix]|uniref:Uncharacterized protein n=1 Tax=Streblomastix strix TaxID=222440 RepID=A0A5J4T2V2_9EUKA|nr:MAG: hypothetical protein EZS28_051759 [Streblomastix strix]
MQTKNEEKQIRKRQSKKQVPQLIETQSSHIDEVIHAPLIDQTPISNDSSLVQTQVEKQEQQRVELRGRPKKYTSQEQAERIAAEQRQRAQQRYRIQRQNFRAQANDLQLLLIRHLQKIVINNMQDLLQINDIIEQEDRHHVLDKLAKTEDDMINGRIEDKDMNRWKIDAISDIIEYILMSNEYSKKKYYDPI